MKDLIAKLMSYEVGEMSNAQAVDFFQELVDTRVITHLQGNYQRTALAYISMGLITENV